MTSTDNGYQAGDLVRITGTWTDPNNAGAPVDPTALTLRVWTPGLPGTTYTYGTDVAVVKDSVGAYHCDIDTTSTGTAGSSVRWSYEWTSTGVAQAAQVGRFTVRYPPA